MIRNQLPVEIKDNELPVEEKKHSFVFDDDKNRTSGGFTSTIFLVAMMIVCFMWGMLVVILR